MKMHILIYKICGVKYKDRLMPLLSYTKILLLFDKSKKKGNYIDVFFVLLNGKFARYVKLSYLCKFGNDNYI